jgi:Helicase associated domain
VFGDYKLGQWVAEQRHREANVSPKHKKRLNAIGFVWDWYERHWEKGFAALKQFKACEGHRLVPNSNSDGKRFKLGHWVSRRRHRKNKLFHRKQLNKMGFARPSRT